jgi:hypothetical protein
MTGGKTGKFNTITGEFVADDEVNQNNDQNTQKMHYNTVQDDNTVINFIRNCISEIERLSGNKDSMPADILERLIVREYRKIQTAVTAISTLRAATAVQNGTLSQRTAADLLNMHPHTLRRWMDHHLATPIDTVRKVDKQQYNDPDALGRAASINDKPLNS